MIFHRSRTKKPTDSFTKGTSAPLVALNPGDSTYIQLETHFLEGWKHPQKPKPYVRAIFEIVAPEENLIAFWRYRALVELSRVPKHANEQMLFHGTSRKCLLGDRKRRTRLCKLPGCLLCSVIRSSFDIAKCGTRHNFRRFGNGIYTTDCSSKADDYFAGAPESPFRAVLVNRVIVGTPFKRKGNAKDLTEPPSGYHSVIVVGEPGHHLNYGETVVYNNDAIRPAYLIVYGRTPAPETHANNFRSIISTLFKTPMAS
ncbi:hypothetical protein B0H10DRAFT_2163667 [Mycena sp. CBHHK59/15]|nr:hypothetical protein B0H10DRAFT_2163667 [Mycena sp. CBHHK59/15]